MGVSRENVIAGLKRVPRGTPKDAGKDPLEDSRHELFCATYIKNGFDRAAAYSEAYNRRGSTKKQLQTQANRLLKNPQVRDRLRYLLKTEADSRVSLGAIQKDAIEGRVWEIVERCMGNKKVSTPKHLKGRVFEPCRACADKEPRSWCRSCKHNEKLIADWEKFGGIYRFDASGAIKALLPLGTDRGLFIPRKLTGHMEGDEIIDSMSDEEVRLLVRSLASEVGLRVVETRSEGASGAAPEQDPELRAVH